MRARIVFLIKVPAERREDFLAAYEKIRHLVAGGVPGHLRDQVCQSATDPEQWLITSEWRELADFLAWEAAGEHRDLVAPMRECMTEARSLRFLIHEETETAVPPSEGTGAVVAAVVARGPS
jgi:heme oxygenase (mycobilin-producing)